MAKREVDKVNGCLTAIFNIFGLSQKSDTIESLPYRTRESVLTLAEHHFYLTLSQAIGDKVIILPKVGLQDVFFIIDRERYQATRNRISQRHIDFLLCDRDTLRPLLGIELDDSSHNEQTQKRRDEFKNKVFEAAMLSLIRIPFQTSYSSEKIKDKLAPYLAKSGNSATNPPPICPIHGLPMIIKTAHRGKFNGQSFYSCPKFPECTEKVDIPK